ncbi:MAG: hypothetical protein SOZ22_05170 [Ezakiella sp.]|nr:hypothetical protein [Bacillota bacterium]MDY3923693.1 hypothetical protein [Ezakiella sp.]
MLNYKKYIFGSGGALILYFVFCYAFKKQPDAIIGGLLAGVIVIIMSSLDLKHIKKDFNIMKEQVNEFKSTQNVEKFIKSQIELMGSTKNNSIKNILKLNIASAYAEQFDKINAKKFLDMVDLDEFDKKNFYNAVLNKIFLLYQIGENEEAHKLYDETFSSGYKAGGILYEVVKILRYNISSKNGIKELSELKIKEGSETYRDIIRLAKEIISRNIKEV